MAGCGEQLGAVHRCGECGEDVYAVADLRVLWEEFVSCDWPDKGIEAFLDWLGARLSFPPLPV